MWVLMTGLVPVVTNTAAPKFRADKTYPVNP